MTTFAKWKAFFCPQPNWEARYMAYKAGQKVWEVPNNPEVPKLTPWPLEWFPHSLTNLETEADKKRGFAFLTVTCVETGQECPPGVGVCCLRCGVNLSPKAAHMVSAFDAPYCARCRWPLLLTLR